MKTLEENQQFSNLWTLRCYNFADTDFIKPLRFEEKKSINGVFILHDFKVVRHLAQNSLVKQIFSFFS